MTTTTATSRPAAPCPPWERSPEEMARRAMRAAELFLLRRGLDVLDCSGATVACRDEEGAAVFVGVRAAVGGFPPEGGAPRTAGAQGAPHCPEGAPARCDVVDVALMRSGRAFVRHRAEAPQEMWAAAPR